jgi:hypothetical protein
MIKSIRHKLLPSQSMIPSCWVDEIKVKNDDKLSAIDIQISLLLSYNELNKRDQCTRRDEEDLYDKTNCADQLICYSSHPWFYHGFV